MRIAVILFLASCAGQGQDMEALFNARCAACHNTVGGAGAPLPETLRKMSSKTILEALETGKMKAMGEALTADQRAAISKYLGIAGTEVIPPSTHCSASPVLKKGAPSSNGWASLENTRFQPTRAAGLRREDVPRLKLKWAFGFPGATTSFATPSVFGGRLFVGSAEGIVYSLDAETGCIYWTFAASEGVRTGILVDPKGRTAYFGDLHGWVYAVNARTGTLVWKIHADEHAFAVITGTPKLEGGRLYVGVSGGNEPIAAGNPTFECCTFRGSLLALDAATGKQIWRTYTIPDAAKVTGRNSAGAQMWAPSGVSIWSSPTLDMQRKALYASTGVNFTEPTTANSDAVLAFDMNSGRILWSRQFTAGDAFNFGCTGDNTANCPKKPGRDSDFGNSPILRALGAGKRVLVLGQKSGVVHAIDPDHDGKVLWETRIAEGGPQGGVLWGGASDDQGKAYFARSDWDPGKPQAGGGLFALQLATGEKLWSTPAPKPPCLGTPGCSAAQSGPVTAIPGAVFSGSLDGHIRAYDASSGAIIWDFDTAQDFHAVDGVKARGGSVNSGAPTIAGGMLYVTSGYSRIPSMPGNVLLAFSVDGK